MYVQTFATNGRFLRRMVIFVDKLCFFSVYCIKLGFRGGIYEYISFWIRVISDV